MSCDRFDAQIPDYIEGKLHPYRELENHLKECPECNQKAADARLVLHSFAKWTEEPMPTWNRAPIGFFNQKRPSLVWRWAPLLLACVLFGFVFFNLEITIHPEGTTIRFSKEDRTEIPSDFLEILNARDKNYQSSIEELLKKHQSQQNTLVLNIVESALKKNQTQFTSGLNAINENWKAQRDLDNRYWGQQITGIYRNTNRNNESLNLLANHIKQYK